MSQLLNAAIQELYTGKTKPMQRGSKVKNINDRISQTVQDHSTGRHADWECRSHEQGLAFYRKFGREWTYQEYERWYAHYWQSTRPTSRTAIRDCQVCVAAIKLAKEQGIDPFRCPDDIRARMTLLSRRLSLSNGLCYLDNIRV